MITGRQMDKRFLRMG